MNERTSPSGPDLLRTLEDARARLAVVVCELENGEHGVAHAVAADLELDFEAAIAHAKARPIETRAAP